MTIQDLKFRCYKNLYIGDSDISGKGLFTHERIKAGEIILSFGGVLANIEGRYSGAYLASTFSGISERIMICETSDSQKDFSDYLNHSCDPNVGMDDCITMVAIKDILPGEELTYDYSFCEADNNWRLKTNCCCGKQNCRKTITGEDWKKVKSTDKLFRYYSPFIQRRIISHERET